MDPQTKLILEEMAKQFDHKFAEFDLKWEKRLHELDQ